SFLYKKLREMARRFFVRKKGQSLMSSDFVGEAYIRLRDQRNLATATRDEFLAAAAVTMERVLLDHLKAKEADKRPPSWRRVSLEGSKLIGKASEVDFLDLHDALERLAEKSARAAQVVRMRFFAGATVEEVARYLKVGPRTVANDWKFAKAWL